MNKICLFITFLLLISTFCNGITINQINKHRKDQIRTPTSSYDVCRIAFFCVEISENLNKTDVLLFLDFVLNTVKSTENETYGTAYGLETYTSYIFNHVSYLRTGKEFISDVQQLKQEIQNGSLGSPAVQMEPPLTDVYDTASLYFNLNSPFLYSLIFFGQDVAIRDPVPARNAALQISSLNVTTYAVDRSSKDFPHSPFDSLVINNPDNLVNPTTLTTDILQSLTKKIVKQLTAEGC